MRYVVGIIVCTGALFLSGTAGAQYQKLDVQGPYTQAATGMVFPVAVGDFQRVNILQYSPNGTDMSAGYNRMQRMAEIVATVYVFPSPIVRGPEADTQAVNAVRALACAAAFQRVQQEVMAAHPDAELLNTNEVVIPQLGVQQTGHLATYRMTLPDFFGRKQVTHSEAYVFCYAGGKWTVEYRIDYPENYNADIPISEFMRNLAWTITDKP